MSNYLEQYVINGVVYAIEDFKSPGEHFFDGKDINGKSRARFMLWRGGGGLGEAMTLVQARQRLHQHAVHIESEQLNKVLQELAARYSAIAVLGTNVDRLQYFRSFMPIEKKKRRQR